MAKDVIITPLDGDIQFENSSGTEAGKIEQSGDDLVLSNAVGDILIGDGTADVYIGDGSNNVDIVFEQNGSIRGEAGSSVDITLGSSDTDIIISGSTFNIDPDANFAGIINANNKLTFTTSNGYVLFDHQPQTGVGEYTNEVPLLRIDYDGIEKTILSRTTGGGAITIGADDSVVIAGGDTKTVIKSNVNLGAENVIFSSETGFHAYGFPNNTTTWANRQEFRFYTGGTDTSLNGLWIGDGGNSQFMDLSRNLKNIGTINSGAITTSGILSLNAGGALVRKYVSTWTNATTHDLVYQGWNTNTDDYIYLKSPGNSTTNHGIAFIGDNVIALGRTDVETGAPELTSATAPISENWFVLNSTSATFSGNINLPTAKFLRFLSEASNSNATVLFGNTSGTGGTLNFKRNSDSALILTLNGDKSATFAGDVTFNGDLIIGNTAQDPKDIIINQIGASTSENTSLMLDGNGVVVVRNLGSNAFNSTTIPTDHGDHAGLYLPIGGGTLTGDLHISNNAAPADDLTLLTLQNGNSTGDIATPNTFIDFEFKDSNANVVPQARIGAHAGDGGDADSQVKEGKGYLTFHTSDTTATSGTVAPPERVRIAHNGNVGIDKPNPNHKLDINQGELRISNNQLDPKIILQGADMGRRWVLSQDEEDNIGSTGFYIAEGSTVDANDALLYLTPSGNVGIGTTGPSQKLEVAVTDTVALAAQPAEPLFVSNAGTSVDGRVLISVKHTTINTASAIGAGLKMTAGAVTSGTPSYFDSLIFLESAAPGSDTVHSAPKAIKFYVDNHGTGAGDGTSYNALGDLAMTIAESANVGIATDTPDYKLEVNGALGVARLSGIIFAGSAGTGTGNKIYGDTSNNFIINTAATSAPYSSNERLRILSSNGNVGIGATNPSAKLEVNGDIALSGNNKVYSEEDTLTLMAGGTSGTYVTVDDAVGGVGVGITSPGYALDVGGTIRGVQYLRLADTGGTNRFNIRATSTFGTLDMGALTFNYIANAHLFLRGASEVMRIHSNSNVGIGTTNPQKKLHVSSGDQLTARIRLSNTNTASGGDNIELVAGVHNVTQDGFSIYNASGGATQFVIQGGGNVGIGVTSPSAKLEVGGTTTTQNLAFKKPTADNQFRGEIVTFGSQSGIAQGDIVAYNSSGQWVKAQANSGTTSKNLLGVAMGTTASAGILLRGFVRDASFGAQTVNKGQHLYLSTSTSGDYQTAVPSTTGHIARIIGYSVDPAVEMIYFCPDNTFVEIA